MPEMYRNAHYIDGAWVPSMGDELIDVVNPTTEKAVGCVPAGTHGDANRAVMAAKVAFEAWWQIGPTERSGFLREISDGLVARAQEIGELIACEVGMPLGLAVAIQAGLPIQTFANTAQVLDDCEWSERVGNAEVVKEPIGVVGAITPWNFPLHQIALKVAPALAAGCTIVLKPSEVAPINAYVLAEVIDDVGLPSGVFNLVTGRGPVVGEALAAHTDVDMVSFTGSTLAGKRVSELAAQTVKRVHLELGGKSASIILDDAEVAVAVPRIVNNAFLNSGQTCNAHTRMLVPRDKLDEVERLAAAAAERLSPGDPFGGGKLGPLVSETQRDRVRGYIRSGIEQGAKLVCGGDEPPLGLKTGYFVQPTVFSEVTRDMTIAKEEIFGPVLSIMPYDSVDEAVEIANGTPYGLSGGVWSADPERAKQVARHLRTGEVSICGGSYNPLAPFGGYKQSGLGREAGRYGLEAYFETKAFLT